jgi:hypothetical protein
MHQGMLSLFFSSYCQYYHVTPIWKSQPVFISKGKLIIFILPESRLLHADLKKKTSGSFHSFFLLKEKALCRLDRLGIHIKAGWIFKMFLHGA